MIPFNNMASLVDAVNSLESMNNAGIFYLIDAWKDVKRCSQCEMWRSKRNFHGNKKAILGLQSQCKTCVSEGNRANYAKRKAKA
jgi:hypothetical protein